MRRIVSAAVTSCLVLVLHVSDTGGFTTPTFVSRSNTDEPGFREVCHILYIISYLMGAIAMVLCLGFVGNQALLFRLRSLQLSSHQDEAHVYNTFQTERQISRPHTYACVVPGQASPTDISTVRHSYIDILPPDSDGYLKPVCQKCSGSSDQT